MVLDGALPQVFARLLVPKSEYESVFLLEAAVLVVLNHHQGQLLLLEVQLGNLGPEEEPCNLNKIATYSINLLSTCESNLGPEEEPCIWNKITTESFFS